MNIEVSITRGTSGLFFAKSQRAPTFLASHPDEKVLRTAIPDMMNVWAKENGTAVTAITVLPS